MNQDGGGAEALLWPTADKRRHACRAFCDHVAAGYSIDSFPGADRKTLRYYAEQFPAEFPPEELEAAARRGLLEWERIGKAGCQGELARFNASAWALNMKNRAGWRDKSELESWNIFGGGRTMRSGSKRSNRGVRKKSHSGSWPF